MKKSELIKKLQEIPGDPEVVIGNSASSPDVASPLEKIKTQPKYQLTEDTESIEDGLTPVIVISDQFFKSEFEDYPENEFREEFE